MFVCLIISLSLLFKYQQLSCENFAYLSKYLFFFYQLILPSNRLPFLPHLLHSYKFLFSFFFSLFINFRVVIATIYNICFYYKCDWYDEYVYVCVCVVCMCKWQKVRFTRKKLIHAFLFVVALGLQIICTSFQKYVFIFKCEKITPNLHAKIRSPNQHSIPPPRFPL